MIAQLSEPWVDALVAASKERTSPFNAVVAFTIGKTKRAVIEISEGSVTGSTDAEPAVTVPFTGKQLDAWANGEIDCSAAYMKGDLKPEGSTGALLAALDLLADSEVRERLRATLAG